MAEEQSQHSGARIWTVGVGEAGDSTTAVFDAAAEPFGNTVIVFGHGASSHLGHATVFGLCGALRTAGVHTVRYNFLYSERKKGPPDRMPKLELCLAAVAASVRDLYSPTLLLAGGHSMGGRAASMLAAHESLFDGLILCGYPLHPAGQPEKPRTEHLPAIKAPVLCCNGTRDELCTRELMDSIVAPLPGWTMHWLDHADHSFHVRKSSGRTDEDVRVEFGEAVRAWLSAHWGG